MTDLSQYIRPMPNRSVCTVESIENGFLIKFHEAVERSRKGMTERMQQEIVGELGYIPPSWMTREVSLYCASIDEVKVAVERASKEYAKVSALFAKGDLDHSASPPF